MNTTELPAGWKGREVVQLVGHSAYGGAVPVIFAIMRATAELGLRPVLLASHPDVIEAAHAEGLEVWRFEGIVREPRPVHDLSTSLRLSKALRARGTSILHTHTSKGGMVGRLAGRLARTPAVIHHTHGFYHSGLPSGPRKAAMRLLESAFSPMADVQVFLNPAEMETALSQGVVRPSKAKLIPNGIPAPEPCGAEACQEVFGALGVRHGAPLVGTIARLAIEAKGLDVGMRAFAHVLRVRPDARWVIVGKGADEGELRAMARSAGIAQSVVFAGHLEHAARLNSCFDVVFAPSRREGQSVSIMEAMAVGSAIVSTRIPGNSGLIDESCARLVDSGDAQAMATALVGLLDSPDERESLADAAKRRYAERFTLERFDSDIKALYVEVAMHART